VSVLTQLPVGTLPKPSEPGKMRNGSNEKSPTLDVNARATNEGAGPFLSLLCLDGLDKILAYDLKGSEEVGNKSKEVRDSKEDAVLLWLSVDSHAWIR
jgi:hypothetical protein